MRGESAHYSADFRVGFDWLKTSTRQIILIWPRLSGRCFPALGSWCMYLLGDLIGSFYHLCVPWLAKVVALITTTTISLGINTIKNISFFLWTNWACPQSLYLFFLVCFQSGHATCTYTCKVCADDGQQYLQDETWKMSNNTCYTCRCQVIKRL